LLLRSPAEQPEANYRNGSRPERRKPLQSDTWEPIRGWRNGMTQQLTNEPIKEATPSLPAALPT